MKRSFAFGEGNMDGGAVSMADFLMLLSRRVVAEGSGGGGGGGEIDDSQRMFECKTCSRRFSSFQALGGHRASHKKPRAAAGYETTTPRTKPRVHECSVCGHAFAIGQALGGHMRRHRAAAAGGLVVHGLSSEAAAEEEPKKKKKKKMKAGLMLLDLNLPPVENDL